MKKFLMLLSILCCGAYADTINLHWLNEDGSIYENSTCVIDSDLILPSTPPTKYGYTFTGWKFANYTPIEYLESTGTQYIDPDIQIDEKSKWLFDVALSEASGNLKIIGAGGSSDTRLASIRVAGNINNFSFYRNNIFYTPCNIPIDTNRHVLIMDIYNNKVQIDSCSESVSEQYPLTGSSYKIYIGVYSMLGSVNSQFSWPGRYYEVKFYIRDVLVRDFIPVLDATGTPCMYDKVTKQFFYNQGTGNFIAGPAL